MTSASSTRTTLWRQQGVPLFIGVVDQGVSSLSNAVALFALAGVSSARDFGQISFVFFILTAALGIQRGLIGTPLTLLAATPRQLKEEYRHALSAAFAIGGGTAAVMILAGQMAGAPWPCWLIAASAPIAFVQDTGRFYCISAGRTSLALCADSLWAGLSLALWLMVLTLGDNVSLLTVSIGWLAAVLASCAAILLPVGLAPKLSGFWPWIRGDVGPRLRYAAVGIISPASTLATLAVATAVVGPTAVAALRGSGTLFGMLNIVLSSVPLVLVPHLRRTGAHLTGRSMAAKLSLIAGPASVIAIGIGFAAYAVPDSLGSIFLGNTWDVARSLLPARGFEYAALIWIAIAGGGLRAQERSESLLTWNFVLASVALLATVLSALVWGATVAIAWALAVAAAIAAVGAMVSLRRGATAGGRGRVGA